MAENKTNTFFKGVSYQTMTVAAMAVLEMVIFPIWSRVLSKTDFGYYAAISGIIAIVMSLSEAGLGTAIIQKKGASQQHVSTAFSLSIIFGLFFSLMVFIFADPLARFVVEESLSAPLRVMSSLVFLHSISSIGRSIMTKELSFGKLGIIQVVTYLISSAVGIMMATQGYGVWSVVATAIISSLMSTVLYFLFTHSSFPKLKIYKSEVGGILSFGGWLTGGVVLNNFTQQCDRLLLSRWLSVQALGAYNRPAGFVSNISGKINGIFDTVLFPLLSDIQDDLPKVQSVFLRSVAVLNSFSVVLAAIFFFNAELIISIFFGQEWMDLVLVLRIVSIGVVFSIDNRLADCYYRSLAKLRSSFFIRLAQAILTIAGIYWGCKNGVEGIATAITLVSIFIICIKIIVISRYIKMNLGVIVKALLKTWKPMALLLIIGIPYLMIPHSLLLNILFAVCFGTIIVIEFVFFPHLVGKDYCEMVYPLVKKVPMISKFARKFSK